MSEMRQMLVDGAARLFEDLATREAFELAEKSGFDRALWNRIEQDGFSRAAVSETRGGDGSDLGDAVAIVREAGRHALPAPLAETLLAELALAAAGLEPRAGVLTVGPVIDGQAPALKGRGRSAKLSGTLHRVPWARHADAIVVLARQGKRWTTVLVEKPVVAAQDRNLANEPRDTVALDAATVVAVSEAGRSWSPEDLRFAGALFRTAAMAGALSRVLALGVQYAKERVQFGRAIGNFQAVQQQLAVLASQSASANAAVDALLVALRHGAAAETTPPLARFEIAAAKTRVGEAGHAGAGIAHAVHAAMGFTQEHSLHRYTRRIWSWRDEFGSDLEWSEWVGGVIARVGGAGLWPFLTELDKPLP